MGVQCGKDLLDGGCGMHSCGGLTQFFAGALIVLMGSIREIIEAQLELARLN